MDNSVLRLVLLDDELLALAYLRTLCESISNVEVVKIYNDPAQFLKEKSFLAFDCVISDIVMPSFSGLEVVAQLPDVPVVFTTAHNEYAADAFDIEAMDYLRKPVQKERLERAIVKVRSVLAKRKMNREWIVITNKGKMAIQVATIVAFSTSDLDRRDKDLQLISGDMLVVKNKSFNQLMDELSDISLIRISKGEVLAEKWIAGYHGDTVITSAKKKNGESLSFVLGDNYKKWFSQRFRS